MLNLRLSPCAPAIVLLLVSLISLVAAEELVPANPLRISQSLSNDGLENRGVIYGLLGIRQSRCRSGYGACNSGGCCPLGGQCCTVGCCAAGNWCYSSLCCDNNEQGCARQGCMPKGANCCSNGSYCYSGYYCVISSSGRRGCCPDGKICSDSGGGEVTRTRTTYTPPKPTTTTHYDPPDPTTTSKTTHYEPPTTTSRAIVVTTSSAVPSTGGSRGSSQGTVLDLNDPQIKWEGSWKVETSPCDPSKISKSVNGTGNSNEDISMTVTFTTSSVVKMSIEASDNAQYTITAGGITRDLSGTPSNSTSTDDNNCKFTFTWEEKLSVGETSWSFSIKVKGSLLGNGKRQTGSDWWLKINQLNVQQSTSGSTSTSPARTSSGPVSSASSTGAAQGNSAIPQFCNTWVQSLLSFFAVAATTAFLVE